MSSLVSLRSYQRRRKSAGARLEGTHSHDVQMQYTTSPSGSLLPETPSPTKQLPDYREKREKRVKSARETRREQETSSIFPELPKVDPEWGKTKYSEDFGPKIVSPVHIRPISPTRMNNPHPSKEFMQWKHPIRIHKHKKATNPPPDIWRYINEGFYEDYLDVYNTGDAKNEVPITNLAKIKFQGKKEKSEKAESIHGIAGKKAQLNLRQSPRQGRNTNDNTKEDLQKILRPPSPQSLMIHHTIKGSKLPLFKEWLQTATTKERSVLLEMLQTAHDDSEEVRLSRVVNDVLQSESAERVQEWLKNANLAERQIVLHVLETLAVATGEGDVHVLTYPALYPRLQHRHHRHHTFPLSLQGVHHPHSSHYALRDGHLCSRHHHAHHSSGKHCSGKSKHSSSSASSIKSGSALESMGLVGKKIVKPTREYDENPELWQHRILRKKLGTSKLHSAGIFNQPQRDIGQHFTIHPEWPTA